MIVCCEGADGAGKATQTQLLAEKLGGTRFAFPNYDSPTGRAILGHLKRDWQTRHNDGCTVSYTIDALVFQCLQTVNRLELLDEIKAAHKKGPVIFDRYSASGLVYGGLDGLDVQWIEKINASLPQPDVWIYLDIPIEESFKRRPERRDRYESDRGFLEKVRERYLKLWRERAGGLENIAITFYAHLNPYVEAPAPTVAVRRWHVVDGMGSIDDVHARIMAVLG